MGIARERYEALRGVRSQFLDVARATSHLTLPYLIKYDSDYTETHKRLITPGNQSVPSASQPWRLS